MIVSLAANPSVDRLFEVERLLRGDIHRPSSFVQVAGGKGLNVARAAKALGADVSAVALLRGHAGRWLQEARTLFEGILYVRGRYPVGSGDSFLAGLVTALDRGDAWEDALRLALGAGAANAELPGAARIDPARAAALAEQADVRPL